MPIGRVPESAVSDCFCLPADGSEPLPGRPCVRGGAEADFEDACDLWRRCCGRELTLGLGMACEQ